MKDIKDSNISAINYLKIFFRRKELLLIPAFAGLILGICATIILPKKYKSSTVILVEEGKSDNPLFSKLAVSTTVQQRMTTIRETILGWENLVSLVKRLNLDKDVTTAREFEDLILDLRDNIILKMRNSNVIELAYVGLDPIQTQSVVKNLTDIFIERNINIQNQETSDAIAFIEEQLKVYEGKIKSAEIAELEDQLNTLLVDSTDKHPTVVRLREQIDQKKEELRQQNLEYTRSEILKGETNNVIIEEIRKALNELEGVPAAGTAEQAMPAVPQSGEASLAKVMLIDKLDQAMSRDKVLARDVLVNENIYNMLLQRLETAKITQRLQSSKEGTRYTILDPPRVPFEPFEPNKPLVIILGLILGTFAGVALVIGSEFLDRSFIDVEDAKDFLGVPLFGAISKIHTEESIRREKEKQRWVYTMTGLCGVTVVILTVVVSNVIK